MQSLLYTISPVSMCMSASRQWNNRSSYWEISFRLSSCSRSRDCNPFRQSQYFLPFANILPWVSYLTMLERHTTRPKEWSLDARYPCIHMVLRCNHGSSTRASFMLVDQIYITRCSVSRWLNYRFSWIPGMKTHQKSFFLLEQPAIIVYITCSWICITRTYP